MALRAAILRHVRVPLEANPKSQPLNSFFRSMSSHDDHITKEEVVDQVLSVVKDSRKVDTCKVTPKVHKDTLEEFKLEIPDKEVEKIDTTQFAIEYIDNDILVFEVLK